MERTVIASFARTPFGKLGGSLKKFKATELGGFALREAINRAGIDPAKLDLTIMGQVITAGCGQVPARQAAFNAGIPYSVPGENLNKVCGSSMRAVTMADQVIRCGDAEMIAAGGMESMSNAPFAIPDMRFGRKMFNGKTIDTMVHDGLWCPVYDVHMAVHGGVAAEFGITREMQDEWALRSQQHAVDAIKKGRLARETFPVDLGKGQMFTVDEAPREDTSLEKMAKLAPIFTPDNTVTAGNAPGCNDGGSAMILMSEGYAEKNGYAPEAVILGHAMYSDDSKYITTVPGHAINKLLKKVNMTVDDIDLFEINEAFAAVALLSAKIAGIDHDKLNVNGGAIAFGHPIGASGARIIMTLVSELQRRNLRCGIAAICSGTAQGDAILVENCKYSR